MKMQNKVLWSFQESLRKYITQSNNSTAKRSVTSVSVTGPWRCSLYTDVSCRGGTLKNPHCSMAMSAEHMSKFEALHR